MMWTLFARSFSGGSWLASLLLFVVLWAVVPEFTPILRYVVLLAVSVLVGRFVTGLWRLYRFGRLVQQMERASQEDSEAA